MKDSSPFPFLALSGRLLLARERFGRLSFDTKLLADLGIDIEADEKNKVF